MEGSKIAKLIFAFFDQESYAKELGNFRCREFAIIVTNMAESKFNQLLI
jgi:hypothetical protein